MSDLFTDLSEIAQKESTGGGIVGKLKLETGYKVFVSGVGNRESFFACDLRDEKQKAGALEKAKAVGKPQASLQLIVYKDFVKGRDVTWQDDRFFVYPLWTNAAKKIALPALKTANVNTLGEMWGRVAFADDPDGRTKQNQNGEEVVDKIAYIAEVFASEQAALASVVGGDVKAENAKATAPKQNGNVPVAYADQPDAWLSFVGEVKKAIAGKPLPAIKKYLAENYKPEDISATLDELLAAVK